MADIAQETNQLSFLIDAYQRIGNQLSEAQDYDRAIRVYKKMLKVCWIHSDTLSEIKVYEMLAIQYFYKQDIKKCQMYLDRSLRGKLEGQTSSSKIMALQQGIRSDEASNAPKVKRICAGALVQRNKKLKHSDSVVKDYTQVWQLIEKTRQGLDFRPPITQMIDEVTQQAVNNRIVRPSTPFMQIPEYKLPQPSEQNSDHMLLPTLSALDMQKMLEKKARKMKSEYRSNQEKADDAKYKLSFNQARVQFNQQKL